MTSKPGEKKTSIHIDTALWDGIEQLAKVYPWNNKNIVAAALFNFLSLSENQQWQAFKALADLRKGIVTLPQPAPPKKK